MSYGAQDVVDGGECPPLRVGAVWAGEARKRLKPRTLPLRWAARVPLPLPRLDNLPPSLPWLFSGTRMPSWGVRSLGGGGMRVHRSGGRSIQLLLRITPIVVKILVFSSDNNTHFNVFVSILLVRYNSVL